MDIYLFLDFDGVTHRENGPRFHRAEYLAEILSKYSNLKIVFSTSWREYSDLDRLKNFLPKTIHDKCVGKTPMVKQPITHPRYREIIAYNQEHGISDNQWIALDDMKALFPADCSNLILVNPRTGFTEVEAELLDKKIKSILAAKSKLI